MRAIPLASDSPFHPSRRSSDARPTFLTVIDGGLGHTEDPPPIVTVAETSASEPVAVSVKANLPAAEKIIDQTPRWWRTLVVLSLCYGRQSIVGWPLYTAIVAWRSYDAKCALDALTLRYGRGDVGFDIGLKISEILRDGTSPEDRRALECAAQSSRFRMFGLTATLDDETVNGASLINHMNWACGLVRSPIPPTTNP